MNRIEQLIKSAGVATRRDLEALASKADLDRLASKEDLERLVPEDPLPVSGCGWKGGGVAAALLALLAAGIVVVTKCIAPSPSEIRNGAGFVAFDLAVVQSVVAFAALRRSTSHVRLAWEAVVLLSTSVAGFLLLTTENGESWKVSLGVPIVLSSLVLLAAGAGAYWGSRTTE